MVYLTSGNVRNVILTHVPATRRGDVELALKTFPSLITDDDSASENDGASDDEDEDEESSEDEDGDGND